jgi:chorismate--pyruvate lyase
MLEYNMQNMYPREPLWRKKTPYYLPAQLISTGSMTKYMQNRSEQCFQVKLLTQSWQNPRPSEALALGISKYSCVMVREVYLLCDNAISMFARSLFPVGILPGRGWQLQYLGESPLGLVLFSDPKLHRDPFDFAILNSNNEDYNKATGHLIIKPDLLPARRSIFCWQKKKLMVEEVFLPGKFFGDTV